MLYTSENVSLFYHVNLDLQAEQQALSNSAVTKSKIDSGIGFTCFSRTVPLPTYVFSFSVLHNYVNETVYAKSSNLPDLQVSKNS